MSEKENVVGVLALQGDVVEHLRALERAGSRAVEVRTPEDLARVDALVVPGGESTTAQASPAAQALPDPSPPPTTSAVP